MPYTRTVLQTRAVGAGALGAFVGAAHLLRLGEYGCGHEHKHAIYVQDWLCTFDSNYTGTGDVVYTDCQNAGYPAAIALAMGPYPPRNLTVLGVGE